MTYVLDSSAVLAAIFNEPGGEIVEAAMATGVLSTVNLAEVVDVLHRAGYPSEIARGVAVRLSILKMTPDESIAIDAGLLAATTRRAGLALGDRFCMALAKRLGAIALTADRKWTEVAEEAGVMIQLIR